jgi:hypothetical protein
MIVLFLIAPFFPERSYVITFLFLAIMLSTIIALNTRKIFVNICYALGFTSFGLNLLHPFINQDEFFFILELIALLSYITFFLICIAVFLRKVFFTDSANWDSIQGGLSVYYLMGILWAFLYQLAMLFDPGAVQFADARHKLTETVYFSFITLATVGYGDNYPVSRFARNLAVLEATLGQTFLTVFIARLVGLLLKEKNN